MTDAPKDDADSLNPYEQKLSDAPSETNLQQSARRPKRLVPPVWVWMVLALTVALIVLVRVRDVSGDHAVVNLLTLLLTFLGCCVGSFWFLFWASRPWPACRPQLGPLRRTRPPP